MGIFKNLKVKLFDITQHKQKFIIIENAMLMQAAGNLTDDIVKIRCINLEETKQFWRKILIINPIRCYHLISLRVSIGVNS